MSPHKAYARESVPSVDAGNFDFVDISKDDQKQVDELVGKLLEHYDSVRVFVTRHDGSAQETQSYDTGGGNLYAQLGQVQEWLTLQNQYARTFADRFQKKGGDQE